MDRKQFMKLTAAGFASLVCPAAVSIDNHFFSGQGQRFRFRPYRPEASACPVLQVTPDDGSFVHTFFDVSPWSPSGRYLVVTKLPYEDRKPVLGDLAEVAIVDLEAETIRSVYKTKAWSFQLGANVQWGNNDRYVYCNDVINHVAVCIRTDIHTGETTAYSGPKYDINDKATAAIGARLELMNATQYGYGIPDDAFGFPVLSGAEVENDDGLWYTDLVTNRRKLLLSYGEVRRKASDPSYYHTGVFYFFHSKFNSGGTRVLQVVRSLIPGKKGRNSSLFCFDLESNELHEVIDRTTWEHKGPIGTGNHPNWHPNGEYIVMNLVPGWEGDKMMRFCLLKADGSEKKVLSRRLLGSGHPSVDPSTRFLITDSYPDQHWVTRADGEVPIRLVNLHDETEVHVCSVFTDLASKAGLKDYKVKGGGSHFKLDPHPAWSRDYNKVCFNGAPNGRRQVFIGDLKNLMT